MGHIPSILIYMMKLVAPIEYAEIERRHLYLDTCRFRAAEFRENFKVWGSAMNDLRLYASRQTIGKMYSDPNFLK